MSEDTDGVDQSLSSPLIVAHRGYAAIAPENTIASFEKAIAAGALAAECDVHQTKDGHIVVSHDHTIDRCTDGHGQITEMTLAQIQRADAGSWKGEEYAGERVPTLRQLLRAIDGRLQLIVEIKRDGSEADVVDVIRAEDAVADCTIVSFNPETAGNVRQFEPRLSAGWISVGMKAADEQPVDEFIGTALAENLQFVSVYYKGARPALLRQAAVAGLGVWVWTVDEAELIRELAEKPIAAITTNDPGVAFDALGQT